MAEETRPEDAMGVQNRLRLRPEADRRHPRRLGEADQIGRHSHAHVVSSAHQFAADREIRLDVAATSPAFPDKFHLRASARSASAPITGASWREYSSVGWVSSM